VADADQKLEAGSRPIEVTAEIKGNVAQIRLTGRIANWNKNNSLDLQSKVDQLAQTATEAELYINTQGGDVFEAYEIDNILGVFEKVTVTVGALAASSGTIFTSKYYTKAYNTSQFMIHKPTVGGGGNEDELASKLKLAKNATKKLVELYATKTKKTEAQIRGLLSQGDYWMTADEALAEGFIDEIIDAPAKITSNDVSVLEACGAPVIPMVTSENQTEPNTSKIMTKEEKIAFLGLEANATDAQIDAGMTALKVDALKQRAATKAAATAQANADAEKVNALVDQAIKDKKITADQKQTYVDLATASYDAAKTALDAMVSKPKLSADLTPDKGDEDLDKVRANWTLDDYLDNDPQAFEKMLAENPEKAEALQAAYYNKTN
jgi:ATP-dependent protease ClpP protease subunit/polyhydroxyalkanoate synthesis regulator phasin